MGFGQGLSGLKSAAQKLDVIGNNIANSNTVGFKASSVSFADVYATSRVGLGTQVAAINQDFTVGNLSVTGGEFDVAIDGPAGMFRVVDESGAVMYTRNGQFSPNKEGYLVNAQGQYLTGYTFNQATQTYSTEPQRIRLPMGNIPPKATGTTTAGAGVLAGIEARGMNLDAREKVLTVPFNHANPKSYNMSVPMTVYDSLGREHRLTQYFVKTADNKWTVHYQLDDDPPLPLAESHNIEFGTDGKITSATLETTLTFPAAPAAELKIPVTYTDATQFGGEFVYRFVQDGYATGEYASMGVSADGTIVANYTNGEMAEVGYIVLADFTNLQGLSPVGGNAWTQTADSGAPLLSRPGFNGMSKLMSQALEESNVDISTELVNMIITQRTYQANAQSITTQSEMMQNLLNIR